ncbi:MAG: glycosyltransferase, partial [Kiritimatiellia bacterium]
LGVCLLAILWVLYVMGLAVFRPESLEKGWASLIAVMVFLGGVQLVSIGMLGQYVSRIFEEGKHRPLYLVRQDTRSPASE